MTGGFGIQCPGCGKESPVGATFCTYCGSRFSPKVSLRGHELDSVRKELRAAIAMRGPSERVIPAWIVIAMAIMYVVSSGIAAIAVLREVFSYDLSVGIPTVEQIIGNVHWAVVLAAATGAAFYGVFSVLAYLMVDRMNKHFERERRHMDAVVMTMQKVEGQASTASVYANRGSHAYEPISSSTESRRRPWFWALAVLLPIFASTLQAVAVLQDDWNLVETAQFLYYPSLAVHVILLMYMLSFMTAQIGEHDRRWTAFADSVRITLAMGGIPSGSLVVGRPLETRSVALYVVLSFVTAGIFVIYWWYVALADPNKHFEKQARFEDQLMQLLSLDSRAPVTRA